jgi:ribosomal protein S18 acetylase RimI-like enzyme
MSFFVRSMTEDDIPRLNEIRPGFISPTVLIVEKTGSGMESGWRLVERERETPFDKGHGYDFDATEQAFILQRMRRGDGLHLVAEQEQRLIGILDIEPQNWNDTALIWNIMLDVDVRGQGLGRDLFKRAVVWGRQAGFRALMLETQTNNVPACKFYVRMGCQLEGIRSAYYSNEDIERGEVAIFWVYKLV